MAKSKKRYSRWLTGVLVVFSMIAVGSFLDRNNTAAAYWELTADVSITSDTDFIDGRYVARPDDVIVWRHYVENIGNSSTSSTGQYISSRYENTDENWDIWDDGSRENNSGLIRVYPNKPMCLDVYNRDVSSGTNVQIWECEGTTAQHWYIKGGFNNVGIILNLNSNKCLDVNNGIEKNGTNVQIWSCTGVNAQKWVYKESTGQIFYRSESSGFCLDRHNEGDANGTNVQIWSCNGTAAQQWIMDNAARTRDANPNATPFWDGNNKPDWYGFGPAANMPGSTGQEVMQVLARGGSRTFSSSYRVVQDDVGHSRCRRTTALPYSSDDNTPNDGDSICVDIPYHYPGMCDDTKEDCGSLTPDCTQDGGCDGTILKSGVQPQTNTTQTSIKPGETANFTYRLSNDGLTKSLDLEYRAYAFILKSGSSIDSESLSNSQVYASFSAAACGGRGVASSDQRYCQNSIVSGTGIVIGSGAGAYPNLNTSYQVNSSSISTSNANWAVEPGDKVCSYLVVDKWSVNNDKAAVTVAASNISCVTVNRNPQLQIRGSDSWAGGTWTDVDGTEQTTSGGFAGRAQASDQRGSWSQYGLFVYQGSTSGFGSAGSTMKSSGLNTEACKLIFANTSCPTSTGAFYTSSSLTQNIQLPALAYSNNLKAKANNAADSSIKVLSTVSNKIDLASLTSGTYWVNNSDTNNILMATGSLKNGVNATIYIDGILEIQNNITTESTSFTELADVPSLTVVAKNIRVTSNVTYIYGTYIARDTFYSAYSATGTQSELLKDQGTYNSQLKIDGALTSRYSPRFLRTLGGGSTTSSTTVNGETHLNSMTASEIINYLPTTFLVPATSGSSGTTWITTKQTVLPARY